MSKELRKRLVTGAILITAILLPLIYINNAYIFVSGLLYLLMVAEFCKLSIKANKFLRLSGFIYIFLSGAGLISYTMSTTTGVLDIFSSMSSGNSILLTLFLIIWISDSAGYAFGKMIGGAKLSPKISPKKTWAGAIFAAIVPTIILSLCKQAINIELITIGLMLSVSVIIGDLLESYLKRKIKVKDSGNMLPGHGGFLDRFDGLLGVGFALLIIQLL